MAGSASTFCISAEGIWWLLRAPSGGLAAPQGVLSGSPCESQVGRLSHNHLSQLGQWRWNRAGLEHGGQETLRGGEGPVLRGKHLPEAGLKGQAYKLPTLCTAQVALPRSCLGCTPVSSASLLMVWCDVQQTKCVTQRARYKERSAPFMSSLLLGSFLTRSFAAPSPQSNLLVV